MDVTINVSLGTNEDILLIVGKKEKRIEKSNYSITAEDLYNLLDYRPGNKYIIQSDNKVEIKNTAFSAFCDFMKKLVDSINQIQIEN